MRKHDLALVSLLVSAIATGGCDDPSRVDSPSAPTAVPTSSAVRSFVDPATGFSTTDLHDAQDQVVHVTTADELVWIATGTRLPGYRVVSVPTSAEVATLISGRIDICSESCWLEVRFGTKDGRRRAYVTLDYGHYNPGTLVDLDLVAGQLVVAETALFPPGTFTLSGRVTEATLSGPVPVEGVSVARLMTTGWQYATTGSDGVYALPGQWNGTRPFAVSKAGYQEQGGSVTIDGNVHMDIALVRR